MLIDATKTKAVLPLQWVVLATISRPDFSPLHSRPTSPWPRKVVTR